MIQYENVSKFYEGTVAISNLNLKIQQGELVVFLGPSGSGKSTLLKMVNRMVSHDSGRILWKGEDIARLDVQALRRRMGYAIQSVGLFPHRTVAHNIATVPKLLAWNTDRIQRRTFELLTQLDLEPSQFANRYPHQLSGGQQQRVGVARAMAADPDVLLMDEPFSALDPVTRASLQLTLKGLHRATGKTILFVTHDIDEALLLATRIVLLKQGGIVQNGTPLELLQQPINEFVVEFFGRENLGLQQLSLRSIAPLIKPIEGHAPTFEITDTATLKEAISSMAAHHTTALRVRDQSGHVMGMVRASDCLESTHA
jgi:osmoprotectant transport system ATP-binding protein